jgi:hypothetical protein
MFEAFAEKFHRTAGSSVTSPWRDPLLAEAKGYVEFAEKFAGCSFEEGLYRIHDASTGPAGTQLLRDAFPAFRDRAVPFGFDWLGRQFALDRERVRDRSPLILLLEPGMGKALEIPLTFVAFHEQLDELREPALAGSFFLRWAAANPADLPLSSNVCVGYRIPLFLSGKDTVDNLEVVDFDVYWTLCGQLRGGTQQVQVGTAIKQITGDVGH